MKFRIAAVAAVALFLPFAATSCSDDNKKVSEGDFVERLQEEAGLSKKIAECMAPYLTEAGLTEGDLDQEELGDISAEKQQAFTDAAKECAGVDLEATTTVAE